VTTPYGSRTEGFWVGMTLVCRPIPFVRFMPSLETWLKATAISHGTTLEHGRVFPHSPALWNPAKPDLVENVQKNYCSILFVGREAEAAVRPSSNAAIIPAHECGGLSPRFGKY
jgi:hypothetical protein